MKSKTPEKLFYRLDEVSRFLKVPSATIDRWEKELPFLQPGLTGGGQKIFRPKDVAIMRRIKTLLEEERLTLAGAKRRVEEEFGLRPMPTVHPEKVIKLLWQIRDELQGITQALGQKPKKS